MPDKVPPHNGQKKTGKRRSKARASHLKQGEKVTARTKKRGEEPQTETHIGTKGGREIVIKGEIPEALAYFLDVYERLGRG